MPVQAGILADSTERIRALADALEGHPRERLEDGYETDCSSVRSRAKEKNGNENALRGEPPLFFQ